MKAVVVTDAPKVRCVTEVLSSILCFSPLSPIFPLASFSMEKTGFAALPKGQWSEEGTGPARYLVFFILIFDSHWKEHEETSWLMYILDGFWPRGYRKAHGVRPPTLPYHGSVDSCLRPQCRNLQGCRDAETLLVPSKDVHVQRSNLNSWPCQQEGNTGSHA